MAKKQKPAGKKSFSLFSRIRNFLSNKTFHTLSGLFFLFFALALFLAFTSFLFNWKYDQSELELTFDSISGFPEDKAKNILGNFGARLGHFFIYDNFGIAAYFISFLSLVTGLYILSSSKVIRLGRITANVIFLLIWSSTFFGFIFSGSASVFGGAIGYFNRLWLTGLVGNVGAALILIFSMLSFLGIYYRMTPEKIKSFLGNIKKTNQHKYNTPEQADSSAAKAEQEDITVAKTVTASAKEAFETPVAKKEKATIIQPIKTQEEADAVLEPKLKPLHKTPAKKEETSPAKETLAQEESQDGIELSFDQDVKKKKTVVPPKEDIEMEVESIVEEKKIVKEETVSDILAEFGEYDPTLDLGSFEFPSIDLLPEYANSEVTVGPEELEANKNRIVETLSNYNIAISKIKATVGPTVTLYEIVPAPGIRISKIKGLENDIALSLAALGIRIIAPLPGKGTIGIEVPNLKPSIVSMKSVLASDKFQNNDFELPVGIGKTISNESFVADLAKMPHLLMAGATGQGKSVGLNAILTSLLYKKHPSQLKFVLVDPKKVELTLFNHIERHYLAKLPDSEEAIITDTKKVINTVNSLCIEMDNRYDLLKNAQCRNIKEYNKKFISRKLNPENGHRFLPYIVLVIDEFADLIMTAGKEIETPIARLAQLARAIGIHLIIATQRPTTNIITGTIKANFPARIAFRVTSTTDSRTILDAGGANQLIGRGDMLFSNGNELTRLQCAFIDTPEVEQLTEFIGSQRGYPDAFMLPEYIDEESSSASGNIDISDRDAKFEEAARIIVLHQQGSASLLQRKLKLGYNRAGRIVDQLEAAGIIGPFEGSKARQVLVPDELALQQLLDGENEI